MADPLSFSQQLSLAVVDKALLGGLVAFVGFVGTRAIEGYKSKQVLRTELTRQRVTRIEQVWKELHAIEQEIGEVHTKLTKGFTYDRSGHEDTDKLEFVKGRWLAHVRSEHTAVSPVADHLAQMKRTVELESFWLGQIVADKARAQLASIDHGFAQLLLGSTLKFAPDGSIQTTMSLTKQHIDIDYILSLD